MCNRPSRSKIFRSYKLEKPKEENEKIAILDFFKVRFCLDKQQYSESDIKELCKSNGYIYIITDRFYKIYQPNTL